MIQTYVVIRICTHIYIHGWVYIYICIGQVLYTSKRPKRQDGWILRMGPRIGHHQINGLVQDNTRHQAAVLDGISVKFQRWLCGFTIKWLMDYIILDIGFPYIFVFNNFWTWREDICTTNILDNLKVLCVCVCTMFSPAMHFPHFSNHGVQTFTTCLQHVSPPPTRYIPVNTNKSLQFRHCWW